MLGLRSSVVGVATMVLVGMGGAQSGQAMETFPMPSAIKDEQYRLKAEELILGVNLLAAAGYSFDDLPPDVLAIYYSDFFLVEVVERDVAGFRAEFLPLSPETERDIAQSLDRIGAIGMKDIFQRDVLAKTVANPADIDMRIAETRKSESIDKLASDLFDRSSQIEWLEDAEVNARLARLALDRKLSGSD